MVACRAAVLDKGVRAGLLLKTKPEVVDERRRRAAAAEQDGVQRVMILTLMVECSHSEDK